MKKLSCLMLLICCLLVQTGCQKQRTDPLAERIIDPPPRVMPPVNVPPTPDIKNAYIETSVKPKFRPAVPDADKASLLYHAKLDLLRMLICAEEQVQLSDGNYDTDEFLQQVTEHFTDIGFRVIEGSPCPPYASSAETLSSFANQQDADMYILLKAKAKQVDKFGNFYSFEADGRGKVAQISDRELLTTKSAFVRGKRALNEQQAANSALKKCGQELAEKLSDEILRKSARGALLRRITVDGLYKAEQVDYVRVGLSKKPGIRSVALKSWDIRTGRAVFWVRLDASVKENLAAYLEQLDAIKLKVERLEKTGVNLYKK